MGDWTVKRRMAALALGLVVVAIGLGLVALQVGLRRLAEEDVPYAMKPILVSLIMYAEANCGFFPEANGAAGIARLFEAGTIPWRDRKRIQHPNAAVAVESGSPITEAEVGYIYLGGHSRNAPADTIVLIEKNRFSCDDGCVGYLDGRVLRVRGKRWREVAESVTIQQK